MTVLQPATIAAQDNFDVLFKVYAGRAYKDLDLTEYPENVAPAAGVLALWTDVTERVAYSGSLARERVSSTIYFSATLNGTNYDTTYFGPGQAILCLYNVVVAGTQILPADTGTTWGVFFVGHITEGGHEDDYKHGGRWSRKIGGLDTLLQRSTAPRLAAGRINLLRNAAVTASSTLFVPATEAGTGEFAGSLVTVEPENTIDDNINTLWISNDAPHAEEREEATAYIQKVFIKPVTGYDQSKLWWIELKGSFAYSDWYLATSAGLYLHFAEGDAFAHVRSASRVIICASQSDFEAYTGGSQGDAAIVDAKTVNTQGSFNSAWTGRDGTFTLNPETDYVWLRRSSTPRKEGTQFAAVAWNQDGSAASSMPNWDVDAVWTGNALDVSDDLCPPGSGIRIKAGQDGGSAADYEFTNLMIPGDDYNSNHMEWLLYALEQQNAALTENISAGATTIELSSTVGFLNNGIAICESDTFTYAGRTATELTGIPATGTNAVGNHSAGAQVNQVIDEVTQYGWPCSQLELLRPSDPTLTAIVSGRVYFLTSGLTAPATPGTEEPLDPDNPDDPSDPANNWKADYDGAPTLLYLSNVVDDVRDYGRPLTGPGGGPRWVQYVLVVFDGMTGDARARMNESRLYLAQAQINDSGLGDIDTLSSAALAQYLLNLAGINLVLSYTASSDHLIGEHATAIMPYTRVLDDLARITGCIMNWGMANVISWQHDMWWPVGFADTQLEPVAILDNTCLHGTVQYSGRKPDESGVRIHARTPDGLHQYNATFPPNPAASAQLIELDDLVVTSSNIAKQLSQTMYYKNGLHYTNGAQEITFSAKGPCLWLEPEIFVNIPVTVKTGEVIAYDGITDITAGWTSWLIESITWEWGLNEDNTRSWKATARGRRYWL